MTPTHKELVARLRRTASAWRTVKPHQGIWISLQIDGRAVCNDLEAAADALDAQGWQPIESAPKDGRRIMLYWAAQDLDGSFLRHEVHIGAFNQITRMWRIEDAMFPNVARPENWPEKWQPLPAAPGGE